MLLALPGVGVTSSSSSSSSPSAPNVPAAQAQAPPKGDTTQSAIDLKRDTVKASEQLQAITDLGAVINAAAGKDMVLVNQANLIPKEYFDQTFTTRIKGSQAFFFFCDEGAPHHRPHTHI